MMTAAISCRRKIAIQSFEGMSTSTADHRNAAHLETRNTSGIDSTAVPPEEPLTVEFNVHTVWKGEVSKVTHLTTARSEPCGFPFKMFEDYLVYADGKMDSLEVRACSRTQPALDAEEDLETIGEGYPPAPGSRGVIRPATLDCFAASGSASTSLDTWPLMLIAGVAWFGIRKRRSR